MTEPSPTRGEKSVENSFVSGFAFALVLASLRVSALALAVGLADACA